MHAGFKRFATLKGEFFLEKGEFFLTKGEFFLDSVEIFLRQSTGRKIVHRGLYCQKIIHKTL